MLHAPKLFSLLAFIVSITPINVAHLVLFVGVTLFIFLVPHRHQHPFHILSTILFCWLAVCKHLYFYFFFSLPIDCGCDRDVSDTPDFVPDSVDCFVCVPIPRHASARHQRVESGLFELDRRYGQRCAATDHQRYVAHLQDLFAHHTVGQCECVGVSFCSCEFVAQLLYFSTLAALVAVRFAARWRTRWERVCAAPVTLLMAYGD
jgi:hypothetical protein